MNLATKAAFKTLLIEPLFQKNFDFSTIEYSVINDEEDQYKYEAYHLELFRSERGRLPERNSIGGKHFD